MSEANITYGTYPFHEKGACLFGVSRKFEGAENGRATAVAYTYNLRLSLFEERFADIEAELKALRDYLDATPEAVLRIDDEDGAILVNRRVRIESDTVPEAWRQYTGDITLTLTARDASLSDLAADASFTPLGQSAVTLHNITSWQESLRTDRYDSASPNRRESKLGISATGTIAADQSLSETDRRAYLIAQKAAFQAANQAKQGTLVFGGESRVVQVESLDAQLAGDASDRLEWSATFIQKTFPDGEFAEAEFDATTATSRETGEVTLSVSGTVRADGEAAALAKALAIRAHYATGRALLTDEIGRKRHHGTDSVVDQPGDCFELKFAFTYRDTNASVLNWELKVSTRADDRTGLDTITYSGRVVAGTSAAALAKARELGDAKHPFPIGSTEELSYRKMGDSDTERFIEITFSYEYEQRNTGAIFAEVSSQTVRDPFSSWSLSVSGYAIAATESAARTLGRTFKLTGYVQTQDQETVDSVTVATSSFRKFSFAYAWQVVNGTLSLEYSETDSRNWETLERQVAYDGYCRGASKTACLAAIATLVAGAASYRKVTETYTSNHRSESGRTVFDGVRFTVAHIGTLAGGSAPGTIVEAEFTVERTFSVDHAVITPIPYGEPHVQTACGYTPGACRITGQASGFSASALESWAASKRSAAPSGGHETPGQLGLTTISPKWQPSAALLYRVSFSWAWDYTRLDR